MSDVYEQMIERAATQPNISMDAILDALTDKLAEEVVAKAGPKLLDYLEQRRTERQDDPLLNTVQIARRLGTSASTVRALVRSGALRKLPEFSDIRIRQSVVDAYGKDKKK